MKTKKRSREALLEKIRVLGAELAKNKSKGSQNQDNFSVSEEILLSQKKKQTVTEKINHQLRITLDSIGDAVIATDIKGNITLINRVAEKLTGWDESEALGKPLEDVFRIVNEDSRKKAENPFKQVLKARTVVGLVNHTLLITKSGLEIPIGDSGAPITDNTGSVTGVVIVFRDQTEERLTRRFMEIRLSLIEYAGNHSLDELLTKALDEVGSCVGSPIGFYHFVEPDQKTLSLQQWSTSTLKEFCKAEGKGMHYSIEKAGVWVDCVHARKPVIHNDYESLPHKKGMPEGHAKVCRELVVPVLRENKVVAILGVGNKPTDYTEKDAEIVTHLADITWEIVKQKKAEDALRESENKLRSITEHAVDYIFIKDQDRKYSFVNPALEKLFQLPKSEILGKLSEDIFGPEQGKIIKEVDDQRNQKIKSRE